MASGAHHAASLEGIVDHARDIRGPAPILNPTVGSSATDAVATMMPVSTKKISFEQAPAPTDVSAWRTIVKAGTLSRYRANSVLDAHDHLAFTDPALGVQLEKALLRAFGGRLAIWLGNRRYGRDHEFWKTREHDFAIGLVKPQSEEGKAIRMSFVNFADWPTVDLVREDLKHCADEYDDEYFHGGDTADAIERAVDERMARERFVAGDERKMECLLLQRMGYTQKEITALTGAARETQIEWRDRYEDYKRLLGID